MRLRESIDEVIIPTGHKVIANLETLIENRSTTSRVRDKRKAQSKPSEELRQLRVKSSNPKTALYNKV